MFANRVSLLPLLLAVPACMTILSPAIAEESPLIEPYLEQGTLADGEATLVAALKKTPDDAQAQFSLGVVRFMRAVERLAQTHYKHGLLQHRLRALPLFRLPVPENRMPIKVGYEDVRGLVKQFLTDISKVEETLAEVDTSDVKLPLHLGRYRLDIDGDGKATETESFGQMFALFHPGIEREDAETFVIAFDGGDVHWLRGYCHVLMAFCEVYLAHDSRELFERCGHLLYPRTKTPHEFLADEGTRNDFLFDFRNLADMVAMIHLINFDVEEPERMKNALAHLEAMIQQSRESWKLILAEKDDDHEWLPNPDQTGVIPGVRVRRDMIDGWHDVLDEVESVLQGKKLVPFWRGWRNDPDEVFASRRGVNLRRVFTEPRQLDLVMWITGTGATPYLEEGELSSPETWNRLTRPFGFEFFGFAFWFN